MEPRRWVRDGATLSRLDWRWRRRFSIPRSPGDWVGPGTFPNYYQQYSELIGLRTLNADRQAHDLYLSIAAETGIAGLACFLMVLYVTLMGLARARKRWLTADPEIANMATAYMLSIVTYLTTGVFLHFAFIRYFWMFIALAGAVVYIASQREQHVAVDESEATMPFQRLCAPNITIPFC
ncbi:MAG: O-antigen ligase family protein [Kouleothrix sp.]